MKKWGILLVLGAMLSAFTNTRVADEVKEMTGYKLAAKNFSLNDYNLWVVTNKEVFCEIFLPAYTNTKAPDFDTEWVLAGKVKTVHNAYTLEFKRASAGTDYLNVYFRLRKDKNARETDETVSMISMPKNSSIKRVNFYHDEVLVRTIPIVTVY
jgi:hypothetical protein